MKCRVLHVITGLSTGGAEMMLLKLLTALRDDSMESVVVSLTDEGTLGAKLMEIGVPVHHLGMSPARPTLSALLRLRKLIAEIEPDIIQGWMYHGNLAASLSALLLPAKIPVLWNIRQSIDDLATEKRSTRWVIHAGAYLSWLPRRIINNSRHSAAMHEAIGYSRTRGVVIPNGFDCQRFIPSAVRRVQIRAELGLSDEHCLIGMIARFHPMKDHANFLKAADLLSKQHDQVRFFCAGRGVDEDNAELVRLRADYGLQHKMFLLGERSDTAELNAALDIAVLSSSCREGFPNVVGEAMACGVPCAVTDVGDAGWLVGDAGRVVPVRRPDRLAVALKELVELGARERHRIGALARDRIEREFSLPLVSQRYRDIYMSMLVART